MAENKKNIPIEDETEAKEVAEEAAKEEKGAKEGTAEENKKASEKADEAVNEQEDAAKSAEDSPEKEVDADDSEESEQSDEEAESERYMRLMAEFQNFKKRAAKEKSDIHAFANERIVNDLLPVLDNFQRALGETGEGSKSDEEFANYVKGMELIFDQLKGALEKAGLKEIQAIGEDFDPNLHNAVMTESSDEYEDGKISKILQKGYTLNDKVIRPSMVAVNKL